MSALSALGTGAARAVGTALVAGLLAAVGTVGVAQHAMAATALDPVKTRPGGALGGFTIRLPDGRLLHFSVAPGAGWRPPTTGLPSSGGSGTGSPGTGGSGSPSGAPTGSPSGSPSGTPTTQPSGAPSASGLPVPVVSSLFPSPPSGSPSHHRTRPSGRPSRSAPAAAAPSAAAPSSATASADPQASASVPPPAQGNDAVPPTAAPEFPASTVPPPLGPQAVLQPDPLGQQIAAPRATPLGAAFAHRGRLLGVGLALIGTGAALFGWRIRRL